MNIGIDLDAMGARLRNESRERYPLDAKGNRFCAEHSVTLAADDWGCRTCSEEDRQNAERKRAIAQRVDRVTAWWNHSAASVGELGGLPNWSWARFGNREWTGRCDRRLLTALRTWDLRSPLTMFVPTGGGKTSGLVASIEHAHESVLGAAEAGTGFQLPPKFVYATGYDLAEASRRRRLGSDEHPLIRATQTRALAILDEVHSSHTTPDVLFSVLDVRERNGLPTVIASGMRSDEFGAAFGAHQLRRVIQSGKVIDLFAKGTK